MSSKVISSLALLALCACAGSKESYVVGAVGPWKQGYGLQNLQGVQLAAEEINKSGGINGHPLKVIERDDSGDGPQAAKIAQEFVRKPPLGGIGHVNSSGCWPRRQFMTQRQPSDERHPPDLTEFRVGFPLISSARQRIALANFAPVGSADPRPLQFCTRTTPMVWSRDSFRRSSMATY